MMKKLFFAVIFFFLTSQAFATTYYTHPSGTGSTCTAGSPCSLATCLQDIGGPAGSGDTCDAYTNAGAPPVTYSLTSYIAPKDGVNLIGNTGNKASVIIQPGADLAKLLSYEHNTNTNCNNSISYVTFDGDATYQVEYGAGRSAAIVIRNCNGITIDNVEVRQVHTTDYSYGVMVYSDWGCNTYPSTGCSYQYSKLWSNTAGDGQRWFDFWPVGGNLSTVWPANGVTNITISNSVFTDNGWNDGTNMRGGDIGLYHAQVNVSNTVFSGDAGGGEAHHRHIVGLGHAEAFWKDSTVSGCTFTGEDWAGESDYSIETWLNWNVTVTQCQGINSQLSIEENDNVTISKNKLVGNLGYGYGLEFSRARNSLVQYNFFKNQSTAIFLGSDEATSNRGTTGTVIEDNIINGTNYAGILARYSQNDILGFTLRNNTINGTGGAGIEIEYCQDADPCTDSSGSVTATITDILISSTAANQYAGLVDDNSMTPSKTLTITNCGFYNNASEACEGTTYNDWSGTTVETGTVCTNTDPYTASGSDDFTLKETAAFKDAASTTITQLDPDSTWPSAVVTLSDDCIGAFGYEDAPPGAGGDTGLYGVLGGTKQLTLGGTKTLTLSGE